MRSELGFDVRNEALLPRMHDLNGHQVGKSCHCHDAGQTASRRNVVLRKAVREWLDAVFCADGAFRLNGLSDEPGSDRGLGPVQDRLRFPQEPLRFVNSGLQIQEYIEGSVQLRSTEA